MRKGELRVAPCVRCGNRRINALQNSSGLRLVFMECGLCHWCGPKRLTLFGAKIAWNRMQKKIENRKGKYGWMR